MDSRKRLSVWTVILMTAVGVVLADLTMPGGAALVSGEPPSQGTLIVDGVPLIPITHSQRAQCQKYANQLHRPIMCPGIFPTPIPMSAAPGGVCSEQIGEDQCGPAIFDIEKQLLSNTKQMFINQSNFQVPSRYIGAPELPSISGGPLGHFVFVEGPTVSFIEGSRRLKSVSVPYSCHASKFVTPTRIHGAVPHFYQCANGPMTPHTPALYLGHDLLTWRERGLLVEVSFHGHTTVNQDLDVAIARSTVVVDPRGP